MAVKMIGTVMPLLQVPLLTIPVAEFAFHRQIKPGEQGRYAVESEWTSPQGHAIYRYEMRMQAEREAPEKTTRGIVTRLENLHADYDGHETQSKLFGVIPFQLGPSGGPSKLSAGGALNTFAFPLLAFTLPETVPGSTGEFVLGESAIEPVGKVNGKGKAIAFRSGGLELALRFVFGPEGKSASLECRSIFRVGTGQLLRSEGSYIEPAGTLTFKIRRL